VNEVMHFYQVELFKLFFSLSIVQTGSGAHPPSYPMDTGGYYTWW